MATVQHTIQKRQKQIELGKTTEEYMRYIEAVHKSRRKWQWKNDWHPVSPVATTTCSSRCFSGCVRAWRCQLHLWGNLSLPEYEYVRQFPDLHPEIALKALQELNVTTNLYNEAGVMTQSSLQTHCCVVAPVYENSEILAMRKSREIIQAATESACLSKELARSVIFNRKPYTSVSLPIVFLPVEFRGMQKWPKCIFLKQEDLEASKLLDGDAIGLLEEIQGKHPQIFCMETEIHKDVSSMWANKVTDKEDLRQIIERCSLSDYLRLKQRKMTSTREITRTVNGTLQHTTKKSLKLPYQNLFCHPNFFHSRRNRF